MKRQDRRKTRLLEMLAQMPIVEYACRRAGVSRATYYRWLKDDPLFAEQAIELQAQGVDLINDLAESKVIEGIKNNQDKYVFYWLNNRHPVYRNYNLSRAMDRTETERIKLQEEHDKFTTFLRNFIDNPDDGFLPSGSDEPDQPAS